MKAQLNTRAEFCRQQSLADQTEHEGRVEQLETLQALRVVSARHVQEESLALQRQARAAEEARQAGIAKAKEELAKAKAQLEQAQEAAQARVEAAEAAQQAVNDSWVARRVAKHAAIVQEDDAAIWRAANANCTANCAERNMDAMPMLPPEPMPPAPKPLDGQPVPGTLPLGALPPGMATTCKERLDIDQKSGNAPKSGVFELHSTYSRTPFNAYCDMTTAGGGWMIAFKQTLFQSGSVAYNVSLLGQPGLSSKWNTLETTFGSLFDYGTPTEFLFMNARDTTQWFTTKSLPVYQHWEVPGTTRYCLYRPYSPNTQMTASPAFNLWSDADIQLMVDPHPSVSAITVGRFKSAQKAPQCMAPQCGAERHGRYNGNCQDGAKGIGDWFVFVR